MEQIQIVTDSTTSLSKEECDKLWLICLETSYILDSDLHMAFDEPEVSEIEFYSKLETAKKCSTGCVNTNTFETCFEDIIKTGKKVVYVGLSASLSSTFSNAEIAMNNLNEKYGEKLIAIIDSRCASYGALILIERIQELALEGKSIGEIESILTEEAKTMSVAFVAPDLSFLFKSGRLSAIEAGIGKLLKIVPIIFVGESGKLKARDRCIGMKLALKKLKHDFVEYINTKKHKRCYITSCNMPKEVDEIKNYIASNTEIKVEDIKTGLIDKTLACCCGPRTIAIFCL